MFNILYMFRILPSKLFKQITFVIVFLFLGLAFLNNADSRAHDFSYKNFAKTVNKYRQEGNPNANVTVILYSDYQCPWCRKFEEKDLPYIIKDYIKTGKILMEYRDFPLTLIHPYAFKAAEYADCAAPQGKYLQIRSLLYRRQNNWSAVGDLYYFLKTHTKGTINLKKLESCVKSGLPERLINSNMAAGTRLRVTGTPTLFIYRGPILYKKLVGYRPYSQINKILRNAVK